MAKTKQQKIDTVKILAEDLGEAKSVVLTDYQGLTMNQLSKLRVQLADTEARFSVVKNSLLNLALREAHLDVPQEDIKVGPTAILLSQGDEVSPIKILVKTLKDIGVGRVKAGFLGQDFLDSTSITRLANLPSKIELQGSVVGTLAAPLMGLANVLQGNLRNLVYALDQIKIQKGGE